MKKPAYQRLESLDVLRGFDLFLLGAFQPLLWKIANASENQTLLSIAQSQFSHVQWEGFAFWDIIMPLFMFMAGVSMPFAFSPYFKGAVSSSTMYRRISKRLLLLFLFGAIVQGNLLQLNISTLRLFSNTLQAIGVGYFFTALIVMNIRNLKTQIGIAVGLLLSYWGIFTFFGDTTPNGNIAEIIDRALLGRFRDGVSWTDGSWTFSENYHYTWILSSINFVVTVLTGYFAGTILKSAQSSSAKIKWLTMVGVALCLIAFAWSFQHPIIKKVWSSSMTLLSSGYCFLLMALFYWLVDVKGYRQQLAWLKPYGMNSIVAYMLFFLLRMESMVKVWTQGLSQFTGAYYPAIVTLVECSIIYFILHLLYKHNKFFKI